MLSFIRLTSVMVSVDRSKTLTKTVSVAGSNLNCVDLVQEISKEKTFRMWHKDCFLWYFGEECDYILPLSEKSA